ncbi:MAG: response regulator [Anaerolineaceae bacterium]|nr:response regulator [Anaerolineaceae bacterium]
MVKILVIEDEKDIRHLLIYTLQYAGFNVISGRDGEEAVRLADEEIPDIILMDVRMPRLDGYEACKMIKANEKTAHIPVMFLSAKGQDTEIDKGFEAGASDYLLKPFTPTELIERVKLTLKENKISQENE